MLQHHPAGLFFGGGPSIGKDRGDSVHTALLLFAGYLDAATSMAVSSGGGGSDTGGWGRDKDEDELEWARRCARMANSMCKRRKGLHR